MYFCLEIDSANNCLSWFDYSSSLSVNEALLVGGAFFLVTALAWGFGLIFRFLLNR